MHSLNILPASCCPQGLPKTVIASGYLIARAGVLFHELAGFPLSSCELPKSTTCSGKGLLSTMYCEVSSEHSGFLRPLFLLRSLFLWALAS